MTNNIVYTFDNEGIYSNERYKTLLRDAESITRMNCSQIDKNSFILALIDQFVYELHRFELYDEFTKHSIKAHTRNLINYFKSLGYFV